MGVAMTRMRPAFSASVAGLSAGSTPMMGTCAYSARSVAAATDVAVLHAITIALAPWFSRSSTISPERRSTQSRGFSPYGALAESPK